MRMYRPGIVPAAILFVALNWSPACFGEDASLQSRWSQLLTDLLDARTQAFSGKVTFEGRLGANYDLPTDRIARHVGERVYDLRVDSFRFEQTYEARISIRGPGDRSLPKPDDIAPVYPVRYLACKTPGYFSDWSQHAKTTMSGVNLRDPKYQPKGGETHEFPLDPLAIGIVSYHDWRYGFNLVNAHERWRNLAVVDWQEEDHLATVSLKSPEGANFKFLIDTKRLVPVSHECTTDDGIFAYHCDTDWEEQRGVQIPVRYEWERKVKSDEFNGREWGKYVFAWDQLKGEFPSRLFEFNSFSPLPFGGNDVHDDRGPESKYIGHLQSDGTLKDMHKPPGKK
ncbi:MAG: hypothetical protein KDA88_10360 [Planctomycetaceae bacterium]|nr:hypothetical protein [Planctomycetaceae bacterium]MCB9950706.1 hypothetical protein [Planctomycetaceae bacterium]